MKQEVERFTVQAARQIFADKLFRAGQHKRVVDVLPLGIRGGLVMDRRCIFDSRIAAVCAIKVLGVCAAEGFCSRNTD